MQWWRTIEQSVEVAEFHKDSTFDWRDLILVQKPAYNYRYLSGQAEEKTDNPPTTRPWNRTYRRKGWHWIFDPHIRGSNHSQLREWLSATQSCQHSHSGFEPDAVRGRAVASRQRTAASMVKPEKTQTHQSAIWLRKKSRRIGVVRVVTLLNKRRQSMIWRDTWSNQETRRHMHDNFKAD